MKVEIDVWNEQTSIKCPKTERLRVRLSDGMCCWTGCPDLDCPLRGVCWLSEWSE